MKKVIAKLGLVVAVILMFVVGYYAGSGKLFTEKSVVTESEVIKSELHPICEIPLKQEE